MSEGFLGEDGRLARGPSQALAASAFSAELDAVETLHPWMYYADVSHVLALRTSGYITDEQAAELIAGLRSLRDRQAADIEWDPVAGDTYNNRDRLLKADIGATASLLSTGRSRRESMTVAWLLATRAGTSRFTSAVSKLVAGLCAVAEKHAATLTMDQTYLQRAHPTTLGHYLLGFAAPLRRSLDRLDGIADDLDRCPAGVGSVNGSRLDLAREFQADLLGWSSPFEHVRDAMWAPDIPIRVASEVTSALVSADRLAEELLIWATAEFDLVTLADEHCRTSVVMPHKKNPYGLAHIRGLARRSLGELVSVSATQLSVSGQPDNRTYCYEVLVPALDRATAALLLLTEIIERCEFNVAQMEQVAFDGLGATTDLVDYLSETYATPNRIAHQVIGRAVRTSIDASGTIALTAERLQAAAADLDVPFPNLAVDELESIVDPRAIVTTRSGDGEASTASVSRLAATWSAELERVNPVFVRWHEAITDYDARVDHNLANGN